MIKKISVLGAGAVGSHVAYHVLARFAPEQLVLADIAGGLARGVALDLEDTRKFLGFGSDVVGTDDMRDIKKSDIVVITAGMARREGMTRYDLLKVNVKIIRELSARIKKSAPGALVVVVTNPVDFTTYVVKKETGFPRERVLGMGSSLDAARFTNLIYKDIGLEPSGINATVMGLHSRDMLPLAEKSTVRQVPLETLLSGKKAAVLKERVQLRGKEIVDHLKKGSAFFAPSLACAELLDAVVNDRHDVIPVSVLLKGEYGLKDVCAGVPCVIGRGGMERILTVPLGSREKKELLKVKTFFKECMTSL